LSIYIGLECRVDLKTFHGLGTSKQNPAKSCKQIHDISLKDGKLENGVYWIKTSADRSLPTYCDLLNGGWTLVGKVSGFVDKLHKFWLIDDYNVDVLDRPTLPRYACISHICISHMHSVNFQVHYIVAKLVALMLVT
jgi:hypothetical protein